MMKATSMDAEEPPSTAAAAVVEKASRRLLLTRCVGPIALFSAGLAIWAFGYFFP